MDLPVIDDCFPHRNKNMVFLFLSISVFASGFLEYVIFMIWKDELHFYLAIVGVILLIMSRTTYTDFTMIPTIEGDIGIIKDKQHDEIIDNLYSRRMIKYMDMYGEIDFENEESDEIEKYKWLHRLGVITEKNCKNLKIKYIQMQIKIKSHLN